VDEVARFSQEASKGSVKFRASCFIQSLLGWRRMPAISTRRVRSSSTKRTR
jgi:hypothetical protein